MQPISCRDFLHNLGYGSLVVPTKGSETLVPLVNPGRLPPSAHSAGRFQDVDKQALALLDWYRVPGLALGLIRGGRLVYARGYGLQSVRSRAPMTEHTVMSVASMSKMLAGAVVMQLVEAGSLSLDDTYVQHVPWFRMADPRYKDIRIRHLLAHTAGLPEVRREMFFSQLADPWYDDDSANRLVRSLDGGLMLLQEPGCAEAAFYYSDVGFDILAALVLELTGEYYEAYVRRHILEPLHMYRSTCLLREVKRQDLAAPHVRDLEGNPVPWDHYPYSRELACSTNLFTNIADMSHWLIAVMNGGVYYNRILQPESMLQLRQPLYHEPWGWSATGYASGFFSTAYAEAGIEPLRMLFTGGGMPGVHTHATLFPDQGIAAIVFANLHAEPGEPNCTWGFCDKLAIQMLRGEL